MKHQQASLIEYLPDFTWVHFKDHEIVDMETLEELLSTKVLNDKTHPTLLDLSLINCFLSNL